MFSAVISGCRTAIAAGMVALVLSLASGCGGAVSHDDPEPASSGRGGSKPSKAGAASGGQAAGGATSLGGNFSSGGSLVDPDPVESGCPMLELPPPDLKCDPFSPGSCGPGAACYPYVDHPEGSGCDQQRYGTICLAAGAGHQGDLCGEEIDQGCAEGFVCVVGQRAGKRCAALCKLGSVDQCAGGLICGELDVAGFGVCG